MHVPSFVRRAVMRVLVWGAAAAVLVAAAGWAGERVRFGGDYPAAQARITAAIQAHVTALARDLENVVSGLHAEPALVTAVTTRDAHAIGDLFDRLESAEAALDHPGAALTVYGPEVRPVAWAGRPGDLHISRLTGGEALFVAPSSTGLRLTRISPVLDPANPQSRLATIVAEAPLSRTPEPLVGEDTVVSVAPVPVLLRLTFAAATADDQVVTSPGGDPLVAIEIDPQDVARARADWWSNVRALLALVACAVLLLLIGPLIDWRRTSRSASLHVGLTLAILGLLAAARLVAQPAVPPAFPLDALTLAAVVAVAASSFEQWRQSRRLRVRVVPRRGPLETGGFVAAQLVAGAAVGFVITRYQEELRTRLTTLPFDVLHFSLHPVEPLRLASAMSFVVLHAALLALIVLIYRVAAQPWVVAGDRRWLRAAIPVFWMAPALAWCAVAMRTWTDAPLLPSALVIGAGIAAAWRQRRYRAALAHASQAVRLTALFLALAVPSVVFYPSLVEAAGRARRHLVETRYAPEVMNQRRNLQLQLEEATAQIDALPDLAELVQAGDPMASGPIPFETAFRVWERTVLERFRLTSSLELHDATGALLSRFALKLPLTGGPQIYQETSCTWELFEEVSPFFAEERRLLHAGRGICVETPDGGREIVGSIALHVTLDYSNLSFITAQSPYLALLRGEPPEHTGLGAPGNVEFTVYGWSRRPLYVSGSTAWPLGEEVFAQILASREPFWARVASADTDEEYDVYFLNDRGGIYALGYPVTSPFGHLVSVAELIVLGAATFLLLLVAGFVYGLIATRTPASGRALLREVRASFYRKLFIAFVAAAVVPVLALALVTRAYIATLMQEDLEREAARTAASASRVVEDVGVLELTGAAAPGIVDDDLVVWLSRVIAQDVNIFDRTGLIASSERSLFAYGLLPRSTQGDVFRNIIVEGRPSYVTRETVGATEYLVAAAPVRVQNRQAILTVPLTLRQQQIEAQIDELDRRVLLGAVLFIIIGALIGYSLAERIADPVNRLIKATGRIARGDLDARILATYSDEFHRLVEAFNRMAVDLRRQRAELERSNRLAAWADMARQVAHDIKNPLTPIQLNAEHLRRVHQDRGAPLGGILDECINNILQQVRLLRQIASEFSSFASSPTAKPVPSSLSDLIAEVLQPYRTGLRGQVEIVDDVSPALPLVLIDRAVLARALTNVIENALHAMPAGGTLRVAAGANGKGYVDLDVIDTGVGMDQEALARIFEPYFSTRGSGTGLGLTIAKRNVELNGGSISVESAPGAGTTVRISLPTAPAAA